MINMFFFGGVAYFQTHCGHIMEDQTGETNQFMGKRTGIEWETESAGGT